ncbi:TetR/AcrR family transcriptional regulator [Agreia sp. Leaf283]|uniref:TetR/AcrR family transcriptional regulator n=1 Tax=Agreia sp. Leaf283 TaxID=1736321 RepID=UPI0006F1E87D|nr:TetR/AcrR family transcriptional regulator [Agreia sp. Leaf283]KQP54680.1 hypothetical protein ASF51_15440 [Agreia sp. Leaf283]
MTTSRGRIPDSQRSERRARMLDDAVDLFLAEGYASTSLDLVAQRSSASKRTVYAYFTDKAGLFTAAVERLHDRIAETAEQSAPLLELCTSLVETLHSDEAVALHRIVVGESTRFPELARSFYVAGPARSTQLLLAALRAAGSGPDAPGASDAERLYALLLGEPHRRRLLGLAPAPTPEDSARHAAETLRALGHLPAD